MLLTFSFWFCCMYFVDDNKFEGSIPSELGLLTKLWTLNVGMYEEIINETNSFRVYFLCLVEFEHTRKSS